MAKTRNTFPSLAAAYQCREVAGLADLLIQDGYRDKTSGAMWRHVARQGTTKDVDALVDRGYDPCQDARPALGLSVLHLAAGDGRVNLVKHLVGVHGVPVDLVLPHGTTPLAQAALHRRSSTIKTLLSLGAQPNFGSAEDHPHPWLPLSCFWNSLGAEGHPSTTEEVIPMRLLLEAGASPNARGAMGGGAPILRGAIQKIDTRIVALLDAFGVDWAAQDINGQTVFEGWERGSRPAQFAQQWRAILDARQLAAQIPSPPSSPLRPRF